MDAHAVSPMDKEARVRTRWLIAALAAVAAVMAAPVSATASGGGAARDATATPIKHIVVIFQENVSFDHYFGTYPYATNPPGEPEFHAGAGHADRQRPDAALLTANPNLANPLRLDRSEPITCDQDHDYTPEQQAFDAD